MIPVKFKRLKPSARVPSKAKPGDACYDIYCPDNYSVDAGETWVVPTGLAVRIPDGYEMQIRGRSGLSSRGVLVHLGTVDSGYRGEVGVTVTNLSKYPMGFKVGERIAQLKLAKTPELAWEEVDELDQTERGGNGYGSTGRY